MKARKEELIKGFRSLLSRNAIIAILYNIAYNYSNNMKNAFRPLVVTSSVGMPIAFISILITIYSLFSFLSNSPLGALIDKKRSSMKNIMVVANVARSLLYVVGFGFVKNPAGLVVIYALDGIMLAFCNVMGPALLAVSVDKKAMGSAFALYTGIASICVATSRSHGLYLFNEKGRMTACLVAGAISLLSAVVLLFLDKEQLMNTLRREKKNLAEYHDKGKPMAPAGSKGFNFFKKLFTGISLAAIPLALCIGFAQIEDQVNGSFLPIYAMERSFDYYSAQSILTLLSGVIMIFIGSICDVIDPFLMVYIGLVGKIIGNFLLFRTDVQSIFLIGFFGITVTDFFITVVRISASKLFPYSEQGKLSATINMVLSLCVMVGTLPAGLMAQMFGTNYVYLYSSITSLLGACTYTYAIIQLRKKKKMAELAQKTGTMDELKEPEGNPPDSV